MRKLSLCLVLAGSAAHAADYPEEYVKRPQVVTQGMVQVRGNLDINLSRRSAFEPVVLAPSVEYGMTDDLQLALRHDSSLCFGKGCNLYNDMSFNFTPQVVGFVDTGFYTNLQTFGDAWAIPFGIGAMYTHDKVLDLGGEFYFPRVIGSNSSGTLDARVLQLLVRYRFETR